MEVYFLCPQNPDRSSLKICQGQEKKLYYHVSAWGFTAMENACKRRSLNRGEWLLFEDPHGLSQSTTIFKAFVFPYEFISSSLPHKFKPYSLGQRRKKKHLHKHTRPRKRQHFKRWDFINVICNRFRLPLWFNRFQRDKDRKKEKLVKIHCKTLTKPMNSDVIMTLKISIERHNRY